MKFLRHILSHMMFIILLVSISAIYYFRNQVLPENYVSKIDLYAEKIHPDLVAIASPLIIKKGMPESEQNIQNMVAPVVVNDIPVAEIELVVGGVGIQDVSVVATKPAEEKSVEEKPVEAKEKLIESVQKEVSASIIVPEVVKIKEDKRAEVIGVAVKPEADKKVEIIEEKKIRKELVSFEIPVIEDKEMVTKEEVVVILDQAISSDKQAASYKEILHAARTDFSNSQFKMAIDKYKELIALEDHEADFYGELGNVYYAMGSWDLASEVYYEAALRLIERGDMPQVYYLQRVLNGLDKKRAEKLASSLANLRR